MNGKILVTGASGQDGFYLINSLCKQGYIVHAQSRRAPQPEWPSGVKWHIGDPTDQVFLETLIKSVLPNEIYNLAGISRPNITWSTPRETAELNALLPQNICELVLKYKADCRLFQAASSEIFGDSFVALQSEDTNCVPQTPYGVSKLYAHRILGAYRAQYGLHICSGILFNHESPRRPLSFVSQKIAYAAAAVSLGVIDTKALDERRQPVLTDGKLSLGDVSIRRDFGFAPDYIEAMQLILRHPTADDYVVGTGEQHSVQEFCEEAFKYVGHKWIDHVKVDLNLMRKVDSHFTRADISKICSKLKWRPTVEFKQLVRLMVDAQIAQLQAAEGRISQGDKSR